MVSFGRALIVPRGRVRIARINAFLQEHITGMPVVQLFNREQKEMRKFDGINQAHRKANIDTIFYYAVFLPGCGDHRSRRHRTDYLVRRGSVIRGAATIGTLVAFIQLARSFYEPISGHQARSIISCNPQWLHQSAFSSCSTSR